MNILLVDDDEIFGQLFKKSIEEQPGVELTVFTRLKQLKSYKGFASTDLILLDYDLYDGTGIEGSELLHKLAPNVPQVIISTSNREIDPEGLIRGFVSKWQGQQEFLDKVRTFAA